MTDVVLRRCVARMQRFLWACALALAMVVLAVVPAQASTSSEMSDDGQDYGWLYHKGDYLYRIDKPNEDMLVNVGGKWYLSTKHEQRSYPPGEYVRQFPVWEYTYDDGTVCFQRGGQVYLPAVVCHTGFYGNLHSGQISAVYLNSSEYPRFSCLHYIGGTIYMVASDITRVVFDETVVPYWSTWEVLKYGDRWFEGFSRLSQIIGLENLPTAHMMTMERMFAGCGQLTELDLSAFDTANCAHFGGMFDGCTSLERLTFGEGWTQGRAREAAANELYAEFMQTVGTDEAPGEESGTTSEGEGSASDTPQQGGTSYAWVDGVLVISGDAAWVDGNLVLSGRTDGQFTYPVEPPASDERYATFPVAMSCERDGETVTYQAGDVIPDGPGTYVVADRTPIRSLEITLTAPDGRTWSNGDENAEANLLVCDYEEAGAEPAVAIWDQGSPLVEGVDYTVQYANNTDDGFAYAEVTSMGDYYGKLSVPFIVKDTGAYAFLYDNGLLCLKLGHEKPSKEIVSSSRPLVLSARWFDVATQDPGTTVPWAERAAEVKRVVVDKSFSDVKPVSTAGWFAGCTQLKTVEGLANINGAQLTSMAGMFEGCSSVTELDLTGIDTSAVQDLKGFAKGCTSLVRLTLGGTGFASVTDSTGYLDGCDALTEVVTRYGWSNARAGDGRLALPVPAFKTRPSFARVTAGTALSNAETTYRLRDLALQFTMVEMATDTYTCTGSPIKPKMTLKLGNVVLKEGVDYTVSYANNIYPGKAKATVMGKGIFSGGLVVPYTIKARVTKVGDRLVITNKSGTYTVKVTKVSKSGKIAEATLLKAQAYYGASTMYLPSECTIGGVKVTVTAVSSKLSGSFANVSTVVVGAKVTKIGSKAFSRAYSVTTLVIKSKRLKRVKNCLAGSNIYTVRTTARLTKAKRRKYKKWFTDSSVVGRSVYYSYG